MCKDETKTPNIFEYATSELTQDAFICWLASWAHQDLKEENTKLHGIGSAFIKSMLYKHNVLLNGDELRPDIKRQFHEIDVVIELENDVLLIEDKVHTREHSDQLERYKRFLQEEYGDKDIHPIYFKTGGQSNYDSIREKGYELFLREDFLNLLTKGVDNGINNDVFVSFYAHLKKMDDRFNSFQNKPIGQWDWEGWKGFYSVLKDHFGEGGWSYVANPSGGFMGYWWCFIDFDELTLYLQLEDDKLCFKISVNENGNYSNLRNHWHSKVMEASQSFELEICKPGRFGHGKQMTVAVLDGDYRKSDQEELLDLDRTVEVLEEAEKILKEAVR